MLIARSTRARNATANTTANDQNAIADLAFNEAPLRHRQATSQHETSIRSHLHIDLSLVHGAA